MANNIVSQAMTRDPIVTELFGGQALSFKLIVGELTLTKYSATASAYAGPYFGSNGNKAVSVATGGMGEKISYISQGFFDVPVAGATVPGANLYLDDATGFYSTTVGTAYTSIVGVALTGATASGDYIKAELIKVLT